MFAAPSHLCPYGEVLDVGIFLSQTCVGKTSYFSSLGFMFVLCFAISVYSLWVHSSIRLLLPASLRNAAAAATASNPAQIECDKRAMLYCAVGGCTSCFYFFTNFLAATSHCVILSAISNILIGVVHSAALIGMLSEAEAIVHFHFSGTTSSAVVQQTVRGATYKTALVILIYALGWIFLSAFAVFTATTQDTYNFIITLALLWNVVLISIPVYIILPFAATQLTAGTDDISASLAISRWVRNSQIICIVAVAAQLFIVVYAALSGFQMQRSSAILFGCVYLGPIATLLCLCWSSHPRISSLLTYARSGGNRSGASAGAGNNYNNNNNNNNYNNSNHYHNHNNNNNNLDVDSGGWSAMTATGGSSIDGAVVATKGSLKGQLTRKKGAVTFSGRDNDPGERQVLYAVIDEITEHNISFSITLHRAHNNADI